MWHISNIILLFIYVAETENKNSVIVNGDISFCNTNWDHLTSNDISEKLLLQKFTQLNLLSLLKTSSSLHIFLSHNLNMCSEFSEEESFSNHKLLLAENMGQLNKNDALSVFRRLSLKMLIGIISSSIFPIHSVQILV